MKKISAVVFVAAILGFATGCKNAGVTTDDCLARGKCAYVDTKGHVTCGKCPGQLSDAAEYIRAFAESKNPDLREQPLAVTLSRKNGDGVCDCMQMCSAGGKCIGCSCYPPKCGSCAAAAEVAPIDSLFEAAR
jgi:hypothetical protein